MNNRLMAPRRTNRWTLGLTVNKCGMPLGNLRNALFALRKAPEWKGVLAYDTFAAKVITVKPPPWGGPTVDPWADEQDTRACEWMQDHGIPVGVGMVGRAIQSVARENSFHPVEKYLRGLHWDGTLRLETWLTRYFGVADSPYVRAVGPRFLISAVARIEKPGCKADQMLILEGPQGQLKSSGVRALARPWFADRISALGTKDSAMEVAGVWLIEVAELDALTRSSNSAIKAFISRLEDRYRPPYGKHVTKQLRQCVFVGTINVAGGYLKDPTGARRFWPVTCGVIDLEGLRRDRDQLFAEAANRFHKGAPWWLETPKLEALAAAEQNARFEVDAWTDRIERWLADRNDVAVSDILVGALGIPPESWSQTAQTRVAKTLVQLGFNRYRPAKKGAPRTPRYRRHLSHQQ
jgi:putative DNA primase/helicase